MIAIVIVHHVTSSSRIRKPSLVHSLWAGMFFLLRQQLGMFHIINGIKFSDMLELPESLRTDFEVGIDQMQRGELGTYVLSKASVGFPCASSGRKKVKY